MAQKTSYIINSINYGVIQAKTKCGGIVATCWGSTSSSDSYIYNVANFGKVTCEQRAGGIAYSLRTGNNCVNLGVISSDIGKNGAICDYHPKGTIKNAYYLNSSGKGTPTTSGGTMTNWKSLTSTEMKSQTFLDELNKNAKSLGNCYSKWKFGKDGFPVLEWINE